MKNKIRSTLFRILGLCGILSILLLNLNFFPVKPALAEIRQQQEAPGEILYQSRHRLRDEANNSWQFVLFKRVKDEQVQDISLRIVGFPGEAEFDHPDPLKITTQGKNFQADDLLAEQSPAANVGQYDLKDILSQLSPNIAVSLTFNLKNPPQIDLLVPPEVILEWQTVAGKI